MRMISDISDPTPELLRSGALRDTEQLVANWLDNLATTDGVTGVDLSEPEPLRLEVVLVALAFIAERARDRLPVGVRLPHDGSARTRLRRLNFQSTCEKAVGMSLRSLVTERDRELFGQEFTSQEQGPESTSVVERFVWELERQGFCALSSYALSADGALTRMIRQEWQRWRHPLALQLLKDHAHGPGRDVARVLVHELLANAIQHPDASMAVMGAAIENGDGDTPSLLVALWDDGRSIIDTLKKYAADGLRTADVPVQDRFYIHPEGWTPRDREMPASWTPDGEANEGELLIGSLMPGISRKLHMDVIKVDRPEPVDWEDRVGFGLHALYRCAVNEFRGEVLIKTKNYFLHLIGREAESDSRRDYDVAVRNCVDAPPMLGNLVVVRLPLTR